MSNLLDLLDDTLSVSHVRWESASKTNWKTLFEGYEEIKAVTYSIDLHFLQKILPLFEKADILLGSVAVLTNEVKALLQAQTVDRLFDIDAEQRQTVEQNLRPWLKKGGQALLQRIQDKSLSLSLMHTLSHQKFYLLSGPNKKRVIAGSANLGLQAFSGRQLENIHCFDDPEAYAYYESLFLDFQKSAFAVEQQLLLAPSGQVLEAPIDSPVFRYIEVGKSFPDAGTGQSATKEIVHQCLLYKKDTDGMQLSRKGSKGILQVNKVMLKKAKDKLQSTAPETFVPHGYVDFTHGEIFVNKKSWYKIGDTIDIDQAKRDAVLLKSYIDAFSDFLHGQAHLQQTYWMMMSWMFVAPFFHEFRNRLIQMNSSVVGYPMYGMIHGSSDAGKSGFTNIMQQCMFGSGMTLSNDKFTKTSIEALRLKLGILPLVIDDLSVSRFQDHAEEILKNDLIQGTFGPVLCTSNASASALLPEYKKRLMNGHLQGAKEDTYFQYHTPINEETQNNISNALYKMYCSKMLPIVLDALSILHAGKRPDLLCLSSEILKDIFKEFTGETPLWAEKIDHTYLKHQKTKILKEELENLKKYATDRIKVQREEDMLTIYMPANDLQEAAQWRKKFAKFLKHQDQRRVILYLNAVEKNFHVSFSDLPKDLNQKKQFWKFWKS